MHHHHKQVTTGGKPLSNAAKAMIMVHGRGANARGILDVANYLQVADFALLAPQALQNTWYPNSFMAPAPSNQPGLSSALEVLQEILTDILAAGISKENIYFLGFSQGACLTAEFLARNADHYGGAFIYSGGVIGREIDRSNYQGDFKGMPILIGCSDVDPHIPLHRVQETTGIFTKMGAEVTERIYPDGPHSILEDELELTNRILAGEAV